MLKEIPTLEEIAGSLRSPDLRSVITADFVRRVRVACHPDRYVGLQADRKRADTLRKEVELIAEELAKPPIVLKSGKGEYVLGRRIAVGDVADIYVATKSSDDKRYVVKVSRVAGGDRLLGREKESLTALIKEARKTPYDSYFPLFCTSFSFRDKIAKLEKRANVLLFQDGKYSLEEVHKHIPDLEGRHIAWIFKRCLTALGFAHRCDLIHGSVTPTHVLIDPHNHGVQLIGWGQSVASGSAIRDISIKYKRFYPGEVFNKKRATPAFDIYMLAKTMMWIAGGDPITNFIPPMIPKELKGFLRSCTLDGDSLRPQDAWGLLEEFDEMLFKVYGAPKFIDLKLA
jgi:serine/threonine protein kinase